MLVNLSNHPVDKWTDEQRNIATMQYGDIVDMPFPAINPHADELSLKQEASYYIDLILQMKPTAVHIMGELTFTFYIVSQLKKHDILCIASTTHRIVMEQDNQTKTITFQFAGFRAYF